MNQHVSPAPLIRTAIIKLLKSNPELKQPEIAERAGCTPNYVEIIRRELGLIDDKQTYHWTAEAKEIATRLRLEGVSARDIVGHLPVSNGMRPTRNAVIGALCRLGIKAPEKTHKPRAPRIAKHRGGGFGTVKRFQSLEALPLPLPHEDDKARVSILDLDNETCRFPVDLPGGGIGYCGLREANRLDRKPYCPGHSVRARQPRKAA